MNQQQFSTNVGSESLQNNYQQIKDTKNGAHIQCHQQEMLQTKAD